MISLSRLNGKRFVLNAELIRTVESRPDTTITLTGGEKMVVKEEPSEVIARVIEFERHTRRLCSPAELRDEVRRQLSA